MPKSTVLFALALALCLSSAHAQGTADPANSPDPEVEVVPGAITGSPDAGINSFCFFAGTPPAEQQYAIIKKLKLGKGSYGAVNDILVPFANKARGLGADAIINYAGSQRFGFWPWRVVRPVVRGVAVKWISPGQHDCTSIGGTTLKTIIETNQPPRR